jgi:hypothetical protein
MTGTPTAAGSVERRRALLRRIELLQAALVRARAEEDPGQQSVSIDLEQRLAAALRELGRADA